MARIETYPQDNNISENDIILGSDGDDINKTKNYRVSDLTQFVENQTQNNIPQIITTNVTQGNTIADELANVNVTVVATQAPTILNFLLVEQDAETGNDVVNKYTYLFPLGNGVYNPISSVVGIDDLVLLNVTRPTQTDINNLPNTVIFDLGDITGSDFITAINNQDPSLNLVDDTQTYYFSYQDGSSFFLQQFIGTNGLYGLNDNQAVAGDFIALSIQVSDDDNSEAIFIPVVLNANTFATEALEIDDFVREFNDLNPNVTVSDKQLIFGYSDTLQNDAGTNYRSVYVVNTGKGTYGLGATQITTSNVLKIRGERINQNLSSYTNDGGFVTDISGKVDKAGDTMTGSLNMGTNTITNLPTPSTDSEPATKGYADDINPLRGVFLSEGQILAIASPTAGDYALLSNNNYEQFWVYNGSAWILMTARPRYFTIGSTFSLSNIFFNVTLELTSSGETLNFPDNLTTGFEVNLVNTSGGDINLTADGTSTISQATLVNGALANVIFDGSEFKVNSTQTVAYDKITVGLYDYADTQASQVLVANNTIDLSNNGAGALTYKDPLPNVSDIYNVATDRFDFSNLNLNDVVDIEIDLSVSTASTDSVFNGFILLGEGAVGEYSKSTFSSIYFNSVGSYKIVESFQLQISSDLIKDNPAKLQIRSTNADSVNVISFKVKVLNRN